MLCNIQDIFHISWCRISVPPLCRSSLSPILNCQNYNIQEALFNNTDALYKNYQDLPSSTEQLQALVDRMESKMAWKTRTAEIIWFSDFHWTAQRLGRTVNLKCRTFYDAAWKSRKKSNMRIRWRAITHCCPSEKIHQNSLSLSLSLSHMHTHTKGACLSSKVSNSAHT